MENFYLDNPDLKFHLNHPLMKKIIALKERNYTEKDLYDYAPFDYEDAIDTYDKTTEIVGEISAITIAPNAESVDKEAPSLVDNQVIYARGTQENLAEIIKANLMGMPLPRKYNGLNFCNVAYVMAGEIISRADAGFANIWGLQDCAETINEFADEEIKQQYLPRFNKGETAAMILTEPDAGSDLQKVMLKATFDKEKNIWLLNGVKRFITNGDAQIALVLARSEDNTVDGRGLSLFLYERSSNKSVIIRRIENKMGIKGSPTCEMVFRDAPAVLVGSTRMGLIKYVMSLMNGARLGVGGQSVGIAEAAYREAVKYANEREQFGKKIIQFPAIYEMLGNMQSRLRAHRSLLYETSRFVDMYKVYDEIAKERKLEPEEKEESKKYSKLADAFTPLLKMTASEMCNEMAYESLQIHGGTGFMKDFPIERIYRDARITTIYEGTTQLQVVAAIRGVLTGAFINKIKEYENEITKDELKYLKDILVGMTNEYEIIVQKVQDIKDTEYTDFQARRLVEIAGNIVMGYLLLIDTQRDDEYKDSAELFIKIGEAKNKEKIKHIENFKQEDIIIYKKNKF